MSISRRSLLIAPCAYAILKPFVDCIEARAETVAYQPCLVVLFKTEGQYVGPDHGPCAANWLPRAGAQGQPGVEGKITAMSPILEPFTPVMGLTSVVGGFLDAAQDNSIKDYHHSNPNIFTGSAYPGSNATPRFESLHWYVADRWKTEPLLLSPGWCKDFAGNTDTHTAYRRVNGDVRLTTPIGQPIDAFQAAFGGVIQTTPGMAADPAVQAQQLARKGLIDFLLADSKRVMAAAGREHKVQIERHLDGIQALSKRIGVDAVGGGTGSVGTGCNIPTAPTTRYTENADDKAAYNKGVMAANKELQEIALLAMRCGLRRVVGYDLVAEGPGDKFWPAEWEPSLLNHVGQYGTEGGYHFEYWHWATGPGSQSNFDFMVKVERFLMAQVFAPIVIGMQDTGTADDNLLKSSLCVYGTQQTYNHSNNNHSFLVFGSAGGRFVPGRSLMYRDIMKTQFEQGGRNINDFLLSVVQTLGFDATSYGDPELCAGALPGFAS